MAQIDFNFTNLGTGTTSTGTTVLKSSGGFLSRITVNSTGTAGSVIALYNTTSTTSSTGTIICQPATSTLGTYWYDVSTVGLLLGQSSSTADVTIVWG